MNTHMIMALKITCSITTAGDLRNMTMRKNKHTNYDKQLDSRRINVLRKNIIKQI